MDMTSVESAFDTSRPAARPRVRPPPPRRQVAAYTTVNALETGVAAWLRQQALPAAQQIRLLDNMLARTTAGLIALDELLTAGGLPDPRRKQDVVQAIGNIKARLVAGSTEAESQTEVLSPPAPAGQVAVICADSRHLAAHVAPMSAHLVITAPSYNVSAVHDSESYEEHLARLKRVFAACHDALVDGGRIAVVSPHGVGRTPWRPLAGHIANILIGLSYSLRGQIQWTAGDNHRVAAPESAHGSPELRICTQTIIVAHKCRSRLNVPRPLPADWLPGELFLALTQDLWQVAPESAQRIGHPAPFPVELAERLIRLYGYPGCHVVDPFAGSGTVGLAAQQLGCRATLLELDASYCRLAALRYAGAAEAI